MKNILNIAGYKFVELDRLRTLQYRLKNLCLQLKLKGTVLLATEGINIMLAGSLESIENFLQKFSEDKRFADIEFKKSYSVEIPFQRLLVKIKKEIITFNVPEIFPYQFTGPRVNPQQLKEWLDANKDIIILDTRNNCEITLGKFKNALDLGIDNFRDFPQAVKKLPTQLKEKTIVMYCTGGVRCEKASAYMMREGFQNVLQLDGGILKYFAECGDAHYEGKCFVFDERVAVDAKLE